MFNNNNNNNNNFAIFQGNGNDAFSNVTIHCYVYKHAVQLRKLFWFSESCICLTDTQHRSCWKNFQVTFERTKSSGAAVWKHSPDRHSWPEPGIMNWAYRWECESCRWPYVKSGSCTTVTSVST